MSSPKRIHWQLVEKKNPKAFVIRSARPDSAKADLKRFVQLNQLRYQHRSRDALADFESMFDQLRLNDDEDLMDRAERRDLPYRIQQLGKSRDYHSLQNSRLQRRVSPTRSISSNRSYAVPSRRSAVPNVVEDDYAYRKHNQGRVPSFNSSLQSWPCDSVRSSFHGSSPSICYMSLDTYDDSPFNDEPKSSSDMWSSLSVTPKDPNLISDDVLNRRIKQAPSARVPPPQPPFGIPNSPVISYIHTFPQSDYSRAQFDQDMQHKRRYRTRELTPHLVHDDLAVRNLRRDLRAREPSVELDKQILSRSASTSHLNYRSLRDRLRPVKSLSLSSTNSSSSLSSPTVSPVFGSSPHREPL